MTHDAVLNYLLHEGLELDQLPPQIRLLSATIGLPATLSLLRVRGGTPFAVPKYAERSDVLANIMSIESAQALCAEYGGKILSLPKLDKALMQLRNRAIHRDSTAGDSLSALARRYSLTTRQISNILTASDICAGQTSQQGQLFD